MDDEERSNVKEIALKSKAQEQALMSLCVKCRINNSAHKQGSRTSINDYLCEVQNKQWR